MEKLVKLTYSGTLCVLLLFSGASYSMSSVKSRDSGSRLDVLEARITKLEAENRRLMKLASDAVQIRSCIKKRNVNQLSLPFDLAICLNKYLK